MIKCLLQNMPIQAALQAADQMLEGIGGNHTVLRVVIDNMLYPITVDILNQVKCHFMQCIFVTNLQKCTHSDVTELN